jgi:vitamin B12 transporter
VPEKQPGNSKTELYGAVLTHYWKGIDLALFGNGNEFDRDYDGNAYEGCEREAGLKAAFAIPNGRVDAGYVYRSSKMEKSYGTEVDSKVKDNAVYGTLVQRIMDDSLVVNASLRYDDYDKYDDETTGKIGFKYLLPFTDAALSANVGTGYRVPSLYERFGDDLYIEANDRLEPESTTSYDVTLSGYGMRIGYFYNEIRDLIDYVSGAYPAPGHYANVEGKSKIQGVDAGVRKEIEALRSVLDFSYQYLDARDQNDRRLLRRPRHKVTGNWYLYATDRLTFNLNFEYAADYLDDRFVNFVPTRVEMGEYIVWNAVVNYGFEEYGGVYLKVVNLFDEEYQVVDGYNTEEQSFYAGWRFSY